MNAKTYNMIHDPRFMALYAATFTSIAERIDVPPAEEPETTADRIHAHAMESATGAYEAFERWVEKNPLVDERSRVVHHEDTCASRTRVGTGYIPKPCNCGAIDE